MAMRPSLLAGVVASCLWMAPAVAQTAPASDVAPTQAALPAPAQMKDASLSHSALKATTFKVATVVTNVSVLSLAAGGVVGGAALTGFLTVSSWLIYTANDYIWDSYAPPPVKQDANESFDATSDVWRNTGKYLTFKPVVASIKLAALYAYTGSGTIALAFGTASILTNTAVFYANNVAWDMYDWYAGTPQAATKVKR